MVQIGAFTDHLLPTMMLETELPQCTQALLHPIFKPGQDSPGPYAHIKPLGPQYLQLSSPSAAGDSPCGTDATCHVADADGRHGRDVQKLAADTSGQAAEQPSQQHSGVRLLHLYCITVASSSEKAWEGKSGELQRAPVIFMKCL